MKTSHNITRTLLIGLASFICLLPSPLFAVPVTSVAPQIDSVYFSDGFETGDLLQWDKAPGLIIQQQYAYKGGFAARATTSGTPVFARKTLPSPVSELYYTIRFMLISHDTSNSVYLQRLRGDEEDAFLGVYVSGTGRLGYRNDITGKTSESSTIVTNNVWHQLQVHALISGSKGQIEVWLNGNKVNELSRNDDFGLQPIGKIELGDSAPARSSDLVFDEIIVGPGLIGSAEGARPVAATISLRTVPPVANVQIVHGGRTFLSDAQGIAQVETSDLRADMRELVTLEPSEISPGVRAELGKWYWRQARNGVAALDLFNQISWNFVNLDGTDVDPQRITSITFKSSHGRVHTFKTSQLTQAQWFQSSRVVPDHEGLINKELYYSLESVMIDGTNVVHRAQQRFLPSTQQHWTIQLLFYPAKFTARDALFGFRTGSGVQLQYPDGQARVVPFDEAYQAEALLPRGTYQVSVAGAGLATVSPLAMTKDQVVDLKLISYLDIGVVLCSMAALALGLLFYGRPELLRSRRARAVDRRLATPELPPEAVTLMELKSGAEQKVVQDEYQQLRALAQHAMDKGDFRKAKHRFDAAWRLHVQRRKNLRSNGE